MLQKYPKTFQECPIVARMPETCSKNAVISQCILLLLLLLLLSFQYNLFDFSVFKNTISTAQKDILKH